MTWNGNDPTLTQTLSPAQQQLLDARNATQLQLSNLAGQGATAARGIVGTPVNFDSAPGAPGAYRPGGGPMPLDPRALPGLPSAYRPSTNLPAMPQSGEAIRSRVIDAMMGRSNIALGQQADQTNSDLIARGITPGTAAYTREQDAINRQRNDARQQAEVAGGNAAQQAYQEDLASRQQGQNEATTNSALSFGQGMDINARAAANQGQAFQQGGQAAQLGQSQQAQQYQQQADARRQAITELLAQRQIPLNEITALMSGSQVTNPFATPGYAQNGQVAPAPIFGATQAAGQYNNNVYNAQAGSANSFMNGLFGLGAAGIGLL